MKTARATWDPSRVWLREYARDRQTVTIAVGARDVSDVADLLCRLSASAVFRDVAIEPEKTIGGAKASVVRLRAPGADDAVEALETVPPPSASAPSGSPEAPVTSTPAEKLRIVGVVTGDAPRAMCTDASATGIVLKIGDRVPRASGGVWRVERITAKAIDFVDPDTRPPARFSLPLP